MQTEKGGRVVGLDIIRLVSCLFVCIVHFNAAMGIWQNGTYLYPNLIAPSFLLNGRVYLGALGVQLFFIVSGASLMLSSKPTDKPLVFYRKRVLNIYPQFWIAFSVATVYDLILNKGKIIGQAANLTISFAGLDGYLNYFSLIPWEFYKLGEWFLGCIILLYLVYLLVYRAFCCFPKTVCVCFGALYLFSLYAILRQIPFLGSSWGLTICACEMFFGMSYIRFGLHQRKKTIYAAVAIFLLALLLGDKLPSDFLTLALAFLILEVVMILSERIRSDTVKQKLKYASSLTYPIFLVHHFLIDRMVIGFDLAHMRRLSVYILFAAFVAASLLLAVALKKYGDLFADWLRKRKTVLAIVMILLLLSYVYTAYRVAQYSSQQNVLQIFANIQMI